MVQRSRIAGAAGASGFFAVRERLLTEAFRQGPAFVVLLLILFGGWNLANYVIHQGIPSYLEQIKTGYREIQASHDANLQRLVETFEREQARLTAALNAGGANPVASRSHEPGKRPTEHPVSGPQKRDAKRTP